MFTHDLTTEQAGLTLVAPNVARDAPLGVAWTSGAEGHETLKMMGQAEADIAAPSLAGEIQRIQSFLDRTDQYNWMIELDGTVVGTVWVELVPAHHLAAPLVSIMIGDPGARGRGVGSASISAVAQAMRSLGYDALCSRHLIENAASGAMLASLGFVADGEPYVAEDDGLHWQNRKLVFA